MSNVQATLLCNGFTVLTLPVDGEAIHVSVSRDTKVSRSACCQTLLIRPLANIELKLDEVLFDHHLGQLNIDVPLVASNHMDLKKHADFYGVDYEHVPITKDTKAEAEARLLELIEEHDIELVVLARYMQILSDELAEKLAGRAINIHHSFLPAFKGARPYHQAHSRGVKLIGATAHYVTADLDEGPIIEQNVVRVDHTKSPDELIAIGRNVEGRTLAQAVRWHAEHRVLMDGTRTVVFS
ncbi:formyltetrahydrofolate deformylase [Brevibacterium sp. HMSC24B04]|uniref:formyltetrahydrofolate deformylase n=1 Tax=Brevibacterium sp. HMSC24B04 TaxID=1581060 RepID=UPI000AE7CDB5|nr:formyltetrahydrofolate deformylase [Brevibacterium sp. HMSC24B04]